MIENQQVRNNSKKEVAQIKWAILQALPTDVGLANIIIALAQVQQDIAELIIEKDPQTTQQKDT